MTTGTDWQVRPFAPGDEEPIIRLFADVFGRPISASHYRWKLLGSPWRIDAPTAWVADTGGRIVGHYAGTPMRLKLGDGEITVVHSCDAMTDPEYRRQGVLSAVGTAATGAWASARVPFLTGLPHAGWGSRREYLGWQTMFPAGWLACPLHPERVLRRARRGWPAGAQPLAAAAGRAWNGILNTRLRRSAQGVAIERVDHPGPELDVLWQAVRGSYEALTVRDCAWVTYRYVKTPAHAYQLLLARRAAQPVGYAVYRLTEGGGRRTGWLVDLFTRPDDAAARAALLLATRQALTADRADTLRALVAQKSRLERDLRGAGLLRAAGSYEVSIVPLGDTAGHPALRDPDRWFVMAGDFDVV